MEVYVGKQSDEPFALKNHETSTGMSVIDRLVEPIPFKTEA